MARVGLVALLMWVVGTGAIPASSGVEGEVTITWSNVERTLPDGRTYFARLPECVPADAAECVDFLARARSVVFFMHGAGGAEDAATASYWLSSLHSLGPDAIFVFGVSKDGVRRWDAGLCCTVEPIDDVGYLTQVVDDIAASWSVDRARVGVEGLSNGGMLGLRAICERPDAFMAVAAVSATYDGPCDTARVRVGQWHGAADAAVPLNGGIVYVAGTRRTFPPVASLAQRMAAGSLFMLRVIPGRGHHMTWAEYRQATIWLLTTMR